MLQSMNKSLSISPSPRAELPPASPSTRSKQSERRFAHRFRLTLASLSSEVFLSGSPHPTQDNRQNRQLTSNRHTYNHTYIGKAFDNGNKYIFLLLWAQFSTARATRENIDHRRCQQVVAEVGLSSSSSYCYGLLCRADLGERGRHRTRPTTTTTTTFIRPRRPCGAAAVEEEV